MSVGSSFVGALDAASSARDVFAALLGSQVSPADFFTTYWEKQPLHVERSQVRSYYSGLFSKAAFDQHVRAKAAELQYGFDLNICICSDDGKKIDMNPPPGSKAKSVPVAAPSAAKPSQKKAAPVAAAASSKQSAAKLAASEGVQTMTIAEALKLAAAQQQKLRPAAAAAPQQEESEDDEEDQEDEGEEDGEDDDEEGEDEDDDDEDDEEELDGTSVATIKKYAPVAFAEYDRLYKSGCTVQALQPQQYTRSMWQLLSHLEDLLGGLAGANCYLTPANSQGLAPHHDDVEVFVLQLEGSKAWKLYEPKMSLPREHSGDFARSELDEPFREILLRPGDLMYLPRGVIHEARTSDEASAHMTVSVYQKQAWHDLLLTLFPTALEAAFYSPETEAFRKGLPLNYLSYMGTAAKLEEEISERGGQSVVAAKDVEPLSQADPTLSRAQLRTAMQAQLHDLLARLGPIMEAQLDACVDEMSVDFMQSRLPPPPLPPSSSSSPFAPASATPDLGPEPTAAARVRLVHPSAVRMVVVPADEDEDDDDEDGDDDDEDGGSSGGHLLLTHSLGNTAAHHLDGRFPPSEESSAASQVQLPLYYAPALMALLRGSRTFIPVKNLKLDLADMTNEDGEAPTEEEQVEAVLELVRTLWQAELIQVETKASTKTIATTAAKIQNKKTAAAPAAAAAVTPAAAVPTKAAKSATKPAAVAPTQPKASSKKRPASAVETAPRAAPSPTAPKSFPLTKKQRRAEKMRAQ